MKYKKKFRFVTNIVIVISATVFLICGFLIYRSLAGYKAGSDSYAQLQKYTVPESTGNVEGERGKGAANGKVEALPDVDFEGLREINGDVVAWLICEDTVIDYPVVLGEDNSYYLSHLFDKTENKAGCLFIDSGNATGFEDKNTIIYGHNMKNGSMFHILMEYKDQAFFDSHPRMGLITPEGKYSLEVFSGFVANESDFAWRLNFGEETDFLNWIGWVKSKSNFKSDVSIGEGDRIVTLSTCSYEFDNARYVVYAKLNELN